MEIRLKLSRFASLGAALALLIAVLPTPLRADCTNKKNLYIRSESALKAYEEIHSLNVRTLMLQVMNQHRDRYAIAAPYVLAYSALHDAQKATAEMVAMLCKIYGQNLEILPNMTPEEKKRIEDLRAGIKRMNDAEAAAKQGFFMETGLMVSHRIRALLKEAEEIADNVERLQNPIAAEELGKLHLKEGVQVSSMDPEQSLRLYVGSESSSGRKLEMADEARELMEFYKEHEKMFLSHVALLPGSSPRDQEELVENARRQFKNQIWTMKKPAASCVADRMRNSFR